MNETIIGIKRAEKRGEIRVKREKLVKILSHDVERIERLITDYSQMLKDEVALSTEKMHDIDLKAVVVSVVDDFNNIYLEKRGIEIEVKIDKAVNAAQKAFEGEWPKLLPRERAKFLRAIGDQLRQNAEMLGEIETIDTEIGRAHV